jgi:hypothetical protein
MPEEWFDVAYINFDKAIMHGRVMFKNDNGFREERYIEQQLTEEQKSEIEDLNFERDMAMQKLLRSFVSE